jgi:hypothetical protein
MEYKNNRLDIKQIKKLASEIADSNDLFQNLLSVIYSKEDAEAITASWILTHAFEMYPDLMKDEIAQKLLERVKLVSSGTIKRNIIRLFQFVELDQNRAFQLLQVTFDCFKNVNEEIAIRAFALTCLEKHIQFFPEMLEEILFLIERERLMMSPALLARAKRFEKMAYKKYKSFVSKE